MSLKDFKTTKERREYIEKNLNIKLKNTASSHIEDENNINCENLIGSTAFPLGIAGPLSINDKDYFIPLATTEGALVASVSRGCKAINLSGKVKTKIEIIGTTRGPVFAISGLDEGTKLEKWLKNNFNDLKIVAEKTSGHLKLLKFDTNISGIYMYVRFYFDTQEAMGMNMATIATDAIVKYIEQKIKINCISISGNFCIDKKPAWSNFLNGRGKKAWAEIILKKDVVREVLKTTPEKFFEVWLAKCMLGSALTGSLGFNAHFANIVAAFFAATGQDMAHVVEGSMGVTSSKVLENGDLYVSIYMPSVMVGTVGGGTKLKIKKEALSIIGAKNSIELAKVLSGAVLAGEISLLASLSQGSLAKTHEKLGR